MFVLGQFTFASWTAVFLLFCASCTEPVDFRSQTFSPERDIHADLDEAVRKKQITEEERSIIAGKISHLDEATTFDEVLKQHARGLTKKQEQKKIAASARAATLARYQKELAKNPHAPRCLHKVSEIDGELGHLPLEAMCFCQSKQRAGCSQMTKCSADQQLALIKGRLRTNKEIARDSRLTRQAEAERYASSVCDAGTECTSKCELINGEVSDRLLRCNNCSTPSGPSDRCAECVTCAKCGGRGVIETKLGVSSRVERCETCMGDQRVRPGTIFIGKFPNVTEHRVLGKWRIWKTSDHSGGKDDPQSNKLVSRFFEIDFGKGRSIVDEKGESYPVDENIIKIIKSGLRFDFSNSSKVKAEHGGNYFVSSSHRLSYELLEANLQAPIATKKRLPADATNQPLNSAAALKEAPVGLKEGWVIALGAAADEQAAITIAKDLYAKGITETEVLWMGDYTSLGKKDFWFVCTQPIPRSQEDLARAKLKEVKRIISEAYGLLLSKTEKRTVLK